MHFDGYTIEQPFLANDRALDFINTAYARGDSMADFPSFVRWLATAGYVTKAEAKALATHATPRERDEIATRAHALRAAMRRVVEAYVAGRKPSTNDLASINAAARRMPFRDELVATRDGFAAVRHVETGDPSALLYFPADAVRELLTQTPAGSIRRCASETCSHLFYDASKNGTRRWCSMAVCGNREKVAALRQRRRAD